jgi:hypothetical protein
MLTKDQALAAMDAHIIRVDAERAQRLARRAARWTVLYPALKRVPPEARYELLDEARRRTSRQWLLYVIAAFLMVLCSWFLISKPLFGIKPVVRASPLVFIFASFGAIRLTVDMYIRSFLRREVPTRYPEGGGTNGPSGVLKPVAAVRDRPGVFPRAKS